VSSVLTQKKSTRGGRVRIRRWLWATLLVLLVAFIVLLSSPLAVRFALRFVQIPGYTLKADEVGGSLWRPELRGVNIQGPGLVGRAKSIALSYDVAALTRQELKFSLRLSDAQLDLDPSKLATPPSSTPTTGGGTAWKISPQSLELQRVTVKVRGAPFTLPDGTVSLNSLEGKGNTGVADLTLSTKDGQAQAKLRYALEPLNFTADFQGDAALGNHWWPGIRAGTVTGQYRFKNDALEGEVRVSGGVVQVPGLEKLTVSKLSGQVTHRGSVVDFSAQGQGFNGPLIATGSVDYQKQRWKVRGTAKPQLEPLFASLVGLKGVTGQPTAQVTASGWTTARVKVLALGNSAFAGVPIPRASADYTFKGGKSTLAVKGDLRALGEAQTAQIRLQSATGKVWNGSGQLGGSVLGAPVRATTRLTGETLSAQGEVLSSAVDAALDLRSGKVKGNWNGLVPYLKNSILRGSFAGPLEQLDVRVSKLEADLPGLGRRSYRGTGYAGTRGYGLDLGVARLDLSPELRGTWQVRRFALPQNSVASGAGKLDLQASTLQGNATLTGLPLGITALSGPLSLDWKRSKADWNTERADLRWTGEALEATLENLSVQAGQTVRLSGPLRLDLSTKKLSGRVQASTNGGQATLEVRGRTLDLKGNFRGFALKGQGDLDTLRATLEGRNKNLVVRASYDKTLTFAALSGVNLNSSTSGTFDITKGLEGLKAQGNFDLSALESFGLKGLQGVVSSRANGEQVTARAKYQGFDISANGNLKTLSTQLEAKQKSLKITANYDKTLEFTALSGVNFSSSVSGTLDIAKGLNSLKVQGNLDLSALESFGLKGLQGVVNAQAHGEQITARAKYQGFDIQAKGNLKTLTAQLEAKRKNLEITAKYNKTLEFTALSGKNLNSKANGIFDFAQGLEGLKARGDVDLSALESFGFKDLKGVINARANGEQITARAKYQDFDISANGNLKTLTAQLKAKRKNLKITASYDKTLDFTALSGKNLDSRATGNLDVAKGLEGLRAQGNFDLSALESFGLKGFQGVVNARANGEIITARANYQGFDIQANGNLKTLTAQLEVRQKNFRITASYDKTLEFTALSGNKLNSRITGTLDFNKGFDSLKAQGSFDLSALESLGLKGLQGVASARADGERVNATAKYQGFDILVSGNLKTLTARLEGTQKNLKITASYDKMLEFTALSGPDLNSSLKGRLDPFKGLSDLKARGQFDLSALTSFGLKGIEGVVSANALGERITAQAKYQGFDISANGNLKNLTAQFEARRKSLKITASYDKTLAFTALSGANLNSSTSGTFDTTKGLKSLKAQGNFDLSALESFGLKGLQGIVSARANGEQVTARAKYQGFDVSANGNLKTLSAQLEANQKNLKITANYDKTLEFTALSGNKLNSRIAGTLDFNKGFDSLKAQGSFDLSALESLGLKGLEGIVTANANGENIRARAKYQGFDIQANGNLKTLTAQLEARQKNLKITANYDKTLKFTASSGLNLSSRATGNIDPNKGLNSLKAQGNFDLSALESFGFKGLQGVVSARANGESFTAQAQYQDFDIAANGNLQALTAQLEARGRGLEFVGKYDKTLTGTLSSGTAQKLALNWSPENGFAVKGDLALEALKSFDIPAKGTLALEASGLDLISARGSGRVNGEAYGARVSGNLTLASGAVTAQLEGDYGGAQARLDGQLYPKVQAAGVLEYGFQGVLERVNAQLSGEYSALRFVLEGANAPRTVSGIKIASQTLTLEGQLTPNRYAKGSWGDLDLEYDGKKALFAGQVPLEYSGSVLTLRAQGDWQPDFSGSLKAALSGPLEGETATLELKGPWKALELRGNWPRYGTRLSGQVALPDLRYDATVTAKVEGYGLSLNAQGKGTDYALEGLINGDEGGVLRLSGRDPSTWSARAEDFQTRGARLSGQLENGPTGLSGSLEARVQGVPATFEIRQNRLSAQANYNGVKGTLEALLDINKLEARAVKIGLDAPGYGTIKANGQYVGGKAALELSGNAPGYGVLKGQAQYAQGKATLESTLSTLAQAFEVGGQNLSVAPQSARVSAAWDGKATQLSLTDAQNNVLRLEPQGLRGGFALPYSLSGVAGRATLTADQNYLVKLSGPLEGQVSADSNLQKFGAKLEAQFSSLQLGAHSLPRDLKLGRLALEASGTRSSLSAQFTLLDSGYKGLPLAVSGSGSLELNDKLGLRSYSAQLSGDLKPFTALLPAELRSSTSLGALEARVSSEGSGVSATYKLLGSEYAGQALSLAGQASLENGQWTVRGDLKHPQLGAQLEARSDGLVVSGLWADVSLLEPYLKQNLSGTLSGTLVLPAYDLAKAQGNLSGTVKRGADSLSGAVNAAGGVWSVNLLGAVLEKPLRVQGNLYPRASATVLWDGLTGQLEGDTQQASARVQGRALGRSVDLSAAYASNTLSVAGLVDGVRLSADARLEDGLKGTLSASTPDLRPLTGLAGNLKLVASFENLDVKGTAKGTVAGYAVSAPLEYTSGKLSVLDGSLEGSLASGRSLTARASGELYPALELDGNASLSGDLPVQTTLKVGGDYSHPKVTATGALEAAQITLGPEYRVKTGRVPFTASLENNQISAGFEGTGISGSAKATLEGGLRLLTASARLSGVALEGRNTAVTVGGTLEWTPTQGLGANLKASGTVLGQAANLAVGGTGALELAGSLGEGRFKATLGRDILERPAGVVSLERVDLSRFWGRPGALGVSARLELGGTYSRPQGTLSGTLEDAKGVLSGTLSGQVSAQGARVNLAGAKIQGWGRWDAAAPPQQAWSARVSALGADVSHLLPPDWNYGAVWLGGNLDLTPTSLEVKGLDVRVENTDLGKLRAIGDLSWAGSEPVGKLRLEGLGGSATLEGRVSEGASLSVNALDLSRWQVGRVSGAATVKGALENPTLEGLFQVAGRYARGEVRVSGRVLDPQISAKGDLLEGVKGPFEAQLSNLTFNPLNARVKLQTTLTAPVQGNVALEAQDFDVSKLTARVKLSTNLELNGNALEANLNGIWPALEGTAQVKVKPLETPIQIKGQGDGTYTLEAGVLGSGTLTLEGTKKLLPRIRASLTLEPLNLLSAELRKNLQGRVSTKVTLEGDPLGPTVALEGSTQALEYAGVRLSDVTVKGGGTLENWTDFSKLSVALEQKGQNVGQASLGGVTLEGLKASAFSSELSLSGTYGAKGADFSVSSAGQFSGKVGGTLVNEVLSADYDLGYGAYGASGKVKTQLGGAQVLSGNGSVRGLPADLVEGPVQFALGGTLAAPTLVSNLNLLGSRAKLEAGLKGATLQLSDGPQTKARGTLSWSAGQSANLLSGPLSGEVALERKLSAGVLSDPVKGNLKLSGTLEKPQVDLSAQYREVSLTGNGSLEQGKVQLRTRTENGTVSWQGQTVTGDVRGFDLSSLNLPGYGGLLELVGSLDLARQKGKLALNLQGIKTPFTIPYLDLPLAGSVKGTLELSESAKLSLQVQTPAGTVEISADNPKTAAAGGWRGQAVVDLKAPKGGTVKGTVTLGNGVLEELGKPALSGTLEAKGLQLNLADTPLSVDGTVGFTGQNFSLSGLLEAGGGKLGFEGDGAVADLVPALSAVGLTQSENGYQVRATLSSVNLKNIKLRGLKLPDYLEGRVSGSATFAESVSTFALRSEALTLAGEELPARLEGTFSGGNLRLRGGFGDSSVVGNVTDGQLSARVELVKTPLHAIIGAFSGPLPGKSYATGAVRYRGRLDNLLGGQLEAVAENLSVEGGSQTLRGYGQLEYARGILKIPGISLSGAGKVQVSGEYSPEKVDFTANFTDASFTPLLKLIPALKTLEPSLKGTVQVRIGGSFEQPSAVVRTQNLEGSFAGIAVKSSDLSGELRGNLLELGGHLSASSALTAEGVVSAKANLSVQGTSNAQVIFNGKGVVDNFGPLEGVKATLLQSAGVSSTGAGGTRWTVQASGKQGGTLTVAGEVAPKLALEFSGQGVTPVVGALFIKGSVLNARGKLERLTRDEATLPLNSPGSSSAVSPAISTPSTATDSTALNTATSPSNPALTARQDRYRLSGAADISSLLFGAVATPATVTDPNAPKTPGGSNFVSPLPDELTTFPRAKAPLKRSSSFLEQLEFDNFDLNAGRGGVKVDENLARAEFAGRLTLSGTGSAPRLEGKLVPVRGSVFLRENEFVLDNSSTYITFDPAEGIYPRILLNAKALNKVKLQTRDVLLRVQVKGDFITQRSVTVLQDGSSEAKEEKKLQLDTTLSTDTGITCSSTDLGTQCGELYALLATGSSDLANLTGNLTQSALKTAVNVFVIGELERGIARALNLSVFRIRTNALEFGSDLKADFTVGTYLTKEFYLQYQVDLQGNGLLDAQYTTSDGKFTFNVNTPIQWLDLSKAKPTFGLSYNLDLDTRSSLQFGVQTGSKNGNELKLLLNYKFSF